MKWPMKVIIVRKNMTQKKGQKEWDNNETLFFSRFFFTVHETFKYC